ncbi:MAG: hydrogenase formation protein HypD [Oligoflexus sp.]
MKYQYDYRLPEHVKYLTRQLATVTTGPWRIMEVCGGQTHSILRYGIDRLIPSSIELIHGPGCPVCVTPAEKIDLAIAIAGSPRTILCSYGDMLRVPGSWESLLSAKAKGAVVRIVYSPMEALELARENPDYQVVFFAVGFETTAPANAMTIYQAEQLNVKNYSMLVAQVLIVPAMKYLLQSAECQIQGFLAAGHVCSITGLKSYHKLAEEFKIPLVVTGFEPVDIILGITACIKQLEEGRTEVENQYPRSVQSTGNQYALDLLEQVYEVVDMDWRGLGSIKDGAYQLREKYRDFDAEEKYQNSINHSFARKIPVCQADKVLCGQMKPWQCPYFAKDCRPQNPLGAPMVSAEGACAAYYFYRDGLQLSLGGENGTVVR